MPLQRNEAFGMALDSDKELLQKFKIFLLENKHMHMVVVGVASFQCFLPSACC